MKRVLSLLVFVVLLNGCNDGNLTVQNIDFSTVATQSCSTNNIIYKLNSQEALILQIPTTVFVNEPTVPGTPTLINIDNVTNRVIYRSYNGILTSDNICNAIAPATPIVNDQWTATSGTIQIITTAITVTGAIPGSTIITGYNHNIIFTNITFAKTNGTQVYENFPFGDYVTTATTLPFLFDQTLDICTANTTNLIYNYTNSEALTLNIDPALIASAVTPLNSPRTGLISSTSNTLFYRLYTNGVITPDYFCKSPVPTLPTISQEWVGANGVTGVSGIVEVTTTTNGNGFKHTIVLKNVTLTNGNSSFNLGDSYIYGDLLTN